MLYKNSTHKSIKLKCEIFFPRVAHNLFINYSFSVLTTGIKTSDNYYSTSQGYYISAGTSIPTSTWTTIPNPLATSTHSYLQYQQPQLQQGLIDPQLRVIVPEIPLTSASNEPGSQITPVRHAPPPPENGELSSLQNGKPQFKTDISAPDDLIPLQNHHPLHPHVHETQKTPQHALYQHGKPFASLYIFLIIAL